MDLEYPKHLHDSHNEHPLAPEKKSINVTMLSNDQKRMLESLEWQNLINSGKNFIGPIKPSFSETQKLIPNLCDKESYILHYRNLKFYLSKGMNIKRVHRILAFDQTPWLKPYIDFNTVKRLQNTSEFEKQVYLVKHAKILDIIEK